jgi:hypothetical protein
VNAHFAKIEEMEKINLKAMALKPKQVAVAKA